MSPLGIFPSFIVAGGRGARARTHRRCVCRTLNDVQIEENVSLAPYTTLRIGGKVRFLACIRSEADLLDAVGFSRKHELPAFVLGGGSNLVVPDERFPGLVLKMELPESIVRTDSAGSIYLDVSAGTEWDSLVLRLCEQGISGMESMAGIPGLVGGAPIQNIGAYGQEVSETVDAVRALDLGSLSFVELTKEQCGFAYRTSIFNSTARGRYVITSVRFRLDPAAKPNLSYGDLAILRGSDPSPLAVYGAVLVIRDSKGMLIDPANPRPETRSAGSFFKNPLVNFKVLKQIADALSIPEAEVRHWPAGPDRLKLPAAWLIEQAGFPKGFQLEENAPVGISPLHTLALINRSGTATCADLMRLRDHVVDRVERKFGVRLEQEPVMLNPAGRLLV